jgi:anti-sigma B factor antagonist
MFEVHRHGDWTVVSVRGAIDVATAPLLRECLADLQDGGPAKILLDLSDVDHIDADGLDVIVAGLDRARARRAHLRLVGVGEPLARQLDFDGFTLRSPDGGDEDGESLDVRLDRPT